MLITVRLTESVQEYSSEGLFSEGKRSAGGEGVWAGGCQLASRL